MMALSATLPPSLEFLVSRDIGLRRPYVSVYLPLDRSKVFYAVKRKQGLSIDLSPLVSNLKSATCSEQVPKTVIFCCTKDSCYNVYKHLWKNVVSSKRDWFGIYHASMSETGKAVHQERFKQSHM